MNGIKKDYIRTNNRGLLADLRAFNVLTVVGPPPGRRLLLLTVSILSGGSKQIVS